MNVNFFFSTKKIVSSLTWIMIVFGSIGTLICVIFKYLTREMLFTVKTVTPQNEEPSDNKSRETSASQQY